MFMAILTTLPQTLPRHKDLIVYKSQHLYPDSITQQGNSQPVQMGQAWLGLPLPTLTLRCSPEPRL